MVDYDEKFTKQVDWNMLITASSAGFEKWLARMPEGAWLNQIEGTWTIKDLVGHLAAWSNLLLDQIEALVENNAEKIHLVDIDRWNEAQVSARKEWRAAEVRREWDQSMMRARRIVNSLSQKNLSHRAVVPWTKELVSVEDLLNLWILHLTQHQEAWKE